MTLAYDFKHREFKYAIYIYPRVYSRCDQCLWVRRRNNVYKVTLDVDVKAFSWIYL